MYMSIYISSIHIQSDANRIHKILNSLHLSEHLFDIHLDVQQQDCTLNEDVLFQQIFGTNGKQQTHFACSWVFSGPNYAEHDDHPIWWHKNGPHWNGSVQNGNTCNTSAGHTEWLPMPNNVCCKKIEFESENEKKEILQTDGWNKLSARWA